MNAIRIFNEKMADELIVIDIDASRKGAGPNFEMIELFADQCFMPVTYGGGVRSKEDAVRIFDLGIEKVSLQSAALTEPNLVTSIATRYGSQAVVMSIDVARTRVGRRALYSALEHRAIKTPWGEWLRTSVEAGAGEILLTDVQREGSGSGLDLELVSEAASLVNVPVTVQGGVGSVSDIRNGLQAGASAVAAGSFFVFQGRHRAVLISYLSPQDFAVLGVPQ
jgi:cyclase